MSAHVRWFSIPAVLFGLACGGGGGGSDAASSASIGLNSSPGIAAGVVQGVFAAGDVGEFTEAGMPDPGGAAPARYEAPTRPGAAPTVVTRALFGPTEQDCEIIGMVTLSGDVTDPDMLDVGDQVIADFELCDDDIGLVFDGIFDFTILSLVGDLFEDSHDASLDVVMTDLLVDEDGDLFLFDGDGVLDIDTTSLPVESYGLAGTRLTIDTAIGSTTLENYTSMLEIDGNEDPEAYTLSASGRLSSSAFSGGVDIETIQDFVGMGDGYPDSGEMLITGAFDATIRILVNDSSTVDLELDQDGNGDADGLISNVPWDELFGIVP